jgi:hypothetical protein
MIAFVTVFSYAAVAAFVAALVCCGARRWRIAATLSSALSLASVAVLVLLLGRFLVASRSTEASSRAEALSLGISELVNCALLPLLAAVAGALLWDIVRRRARR